MKRFNILFIDSSISSQYLTRSLIEVDELPIIPHFICNPLKAINYLIGLPEKDMPDMIVADVKLPFCGGQELAERLIEFKPLGMQGGLIFLASNLCPAWGHAGCSKNEAIADYFHKPFGKQVFQRKMLPAYQQMKEAS